jgi:amidase
MVPVADGSDVMGSLRNPAGWNNVFGLRPTFGRVPSGPAPDVFSQQLGTEGPMARTVTDLALLVSVQAGYDARAPLSLSDPREVFAEPLQADIAGLKLGWLGRLYDDMAYEPGVLDLCQTAVARFEALGCHIEEARIDFPREALWTAMVRLRHMMVATRYGAFAADPSKRALMKADAVWEVDQAKTLTAHDVQREWEVRSAFYQAMRKLFERFDALVLPTAQLFPFDVMETWPKSIAGTPMDTYHRWMEVTVPATMAGCPALAVPAGFGPGGTPMGLQLIGPHRGELGLLRLAYAYEQAAQDILSRLPPALAAG